MPDSLISRSLDSEYQLINNPDYINEITNYSTPLEKQGLPVIFSSLHLAMLMDIKHHNLMHMIENSEHYYKTYKLRKKNGGTRFITAPNNELKWVQRWILIHILEKVPSHPNVFSFRKGTSINQNATLHTGKQIILNVDLYRFFDSIDCKRVYGFFHYLGYAKNIAWDLAKLVTTMLPKSYWDQVRKEDVFFKSYIRLKRNVLPQGAPTSPILSNFIGLSMDKIFQSIADKSGIEYSRYADDITFSGERNKLPSKMFISKIIKQQNFYLHPNKTKYQSRKFRQSVTGLTVNDKVTVDREWKVKLRTQLYFCAKHGPQSHLEYHLTNNNPIKNNFKDHLLGKVKFLYSVEPKTAKKYIVLFNQIEWPF